MQSLVKVILMVAGAVIFLVIGLFIGMSLGVTSPSAPSQNVTSKANPLSSPVITSVFAFGQLASISGTNVTLTSGPNSLTIATDANTKVISYQQTKDATGNLVNQPANVTLADLKTGDYLNINLKVLPSGILNAVIINRVAVISPGK